MRFPWVKRSEFDEVYEQARELRIKNSDLSDELYGVKSENDRLRRELTEVTARIRLEDSILRYLEAVSTYE